MIASAFGGIVKHARVLFYFPVDMFALKVSHTYVRTAPEDCVDTFGR
jgi:hypothetical protein